MHADARLMHTYTCTSPLAIAGAATYLLFNRTQHPGVEASHGLRKDALAEERDGMEAEGHNIKESSGRKLSRYGIQACVCILLLHNCCTLKKKKKKTCSRIKRDCRALEMKVCIK